MPFQFTTEIDTVGIDFLLQLFSLLKMWNSTYYARNNAYYSNIMPALCLMLLSTIIPIDSSLSGLLYQHFYLTAQVLLTVCRTPCPTSCLKMLHKVCLKSWRNFHDLTQPSSYAQVLTGIYQAVIMCSLFSCIYISIESGSLSL